MYWPVSVEHGDSLGNRGSLGAGDVQWMTAGRGIMHQEMPRGDAAGRMHGFQLWANLPSSLKMTAPRYQDIAAADVPEVTDDDGTRVRVVVGEFWGKKGPVEGVAADPRYLDISVPPGGRKRIAVDRANHAFAYVFAGSGTFRDASAPQGVVTEQVDGATTKAVPHESENRSLVLFDRGDEVVVQAGDAGHPFSAGVRPADRGAGGVVRADRDEYEGGAAAGDAATCATARSSRPRLAGNQGGSPDALGGTVERGRDVAPRKQQEVARRAVHHDEQAGRELWTKGRGGDVEAVG